MSGIIATDFLSKGGKDMDSCDSHGRTIYNGGIVLDYLQVSVYAS